LAPLRSFLSSKELFIVLDNAESILDPHGTHGQGIYDVVEQLSRFSNICLCITSRITAIPPDCEALEVPTLSMEAARDSFYRIYKHGERSDSVDKILRQLDFHPLSVTLLATVAHQNRWNYNRLSKEWQQRRAGVLQTEHNKSLAVTIELSLASPTFRELGPDARALLEVVAFFPQGVNEKNLHWLFPTVPDASKIFDKLCALSLTYRNNEFVTMLAPLRDHLRPADPKSCPLLCATKDRYFDRLSVYLTPGRKREFQKARWITSEDANVEHLLNVFTSIDANSMEVWSACVHFMTHLYWHKPRYTVLRPKVEALPDDHPSKPECLFELAVLTGSAGNHAEQKRLLSHTLELQKERGVLSRVALTLTMLSGANRALGLYKEGIDQAKEALEIYEKSGNKQRQARCLNHLARLLHSDKQLDAAENAAVCTLALLPSEGQEFQVCRSYLVLGNIYCSKGEREKAIYHFKAALEIASRFNWHHSLFWTHFSLAELFLGEEEFGEARSHTEQAKSHAADAVYHLGRVSLLQAKIWFQEGRIENAAPEALRALEIFEKLRVSSDLENCRALLRDIDQTARGPFSGSESVGELLQTESCPRRLTLS
jgi:tetratricopeptide (TPR) repeat protein